MIRQGRASGRRGAAPRRAAGRGAPCGPQREGRGARPYGSSQYNTLQHGTPCTTSYARARTRARANVFALAPTHRRLSTRPRARILHSLACARAAADTHAQWHRCLALLPCCEILRFAAASAAHIVARVAAEGAAASESVKVSSHGRALGRSRRRCGRVPAGADDGPVVEVRLVGRAVVPPPGGRAPSSSVSTRLSAPLCVRARFASPRPPPACAARASTTRTT